MSVLRGRKQPPKNSEEYLESQANASIICRMFPKLDLKVTLQTDAETDLDSPRPSLRPQPFTSLEAKYLATYGPDFPAAVANSSTPRRRPRPRSFDQRAVFYSRMVPLLKQLALRKGTLFRFVSLVEAYLGLPACDALAKELKMAGENAVPQKTEALFGRWFCGVVIPCLVIACEQTEVGLDWRLRIGHACRQLRLPWTDLNPFAVLAVYLALEPFLLDTTYYDVSCSFFAELNLAPFDVAVVMDLTLDLLLQQLMYDIQFLQSPCGPGVVGSAMLVAIERLLRYITDTERNLFTEEPTRVHIQLIKLKLRALTSQQARVSVESITQHINTNVEILNEGDGDDDGLANLRYLLIKLTG